jgi:hypothetical protein
LVNLYIVGMGNEDAKGMESYVPFERHRGAGDGHGRRGSGCYCHAVRNC